jgi:hypothetical protein
MSGFELLGDEEPGKPELSLEAYTDVLEMIEVESGDDLSRIAMLQELLANEPLPDPDDYAAVEVFSKKMKLVQLRANELLARSDLIKSLREQIAQKITDASITEA